MSDFGDDIDRAEGLASAERDAGVRRVRATLRSRNHPPGQWQSQASA